MGSRHIPAFADHRATPFALVFVTCIGSRCSSRTWTICLSSGQLEEVEVKPRGHGAEKEPVMLVLSFVYSCTNTGAAVVAP